MSKDWLSDTHIAAPHESHVPSQGNVREPKKLPGWLIAQMAELAEAERARKAEIQEGADRAAFAMRGADKQADRFLRAHGVKLKPKRGGSQIR